MGPTTVDSAGFQRGSALKTTTFRIGAAAAAVALTGALAACGGDDDSGGNAASSKTITVWDPYPQRDDTSDWAKYLDACAPEGMTVKRTSAATADLLNNLTQAVKAGNAPDVVLLDNPAVPDAASSGLLAPADEVGMAAPRNRPDASTSASIRRCMGRFRSTMDRNGATILGDAALVSARNSS